MVIRSISEWDKGDKERSPCFFPPFEGNICGQEL
jgi:hypothetical protein